MMRHLFLITAAVFGGSSCANPHLAPRVDVPADLQWEAAPDSVLRVFDRSGCLSRLVATWDFRDKIGDRRQAVVTIVASKIELAPPIEVADGSGR